MRRFLVRLILAVGLAAILSAVAAVSVRQQSPTTSAGALSPGDQHQIDPLAGRIARAQQRLRDVPGDWPGWAALGAAYLEQARISADPGLYPRAEQAARRSLQLRPDGNSDARVVLGALANARHDFATARTHATAALTDNDHNADAYGVLADALTQLGETGGATAAVQAMLDLRPGLPAYARASYDLELNGRLTEATALMETALAAAAEPHDVAFCRVQLGDLAFNRGDLDTAESQYRAARAADPANLGALHGTARIRAARGDLPGALAAYETLAARSPAVSTLIEYAGLLRLGNRSESASEQLALAEATDRLFTANGGVDRLATAELALARDRPAEAVAAARAEWAVRQHPDVADMLARALHAAGRDAEALPFADRTTAVSASQSFHLGMIRLGLGDQPAARAAFTRALAVNPYFSPTDAPLARRALAALGGPR